MTDEPAPPPQTDAVPEPAPPRSSRRRKWLATGLGAIVVVGGGGFGFLVSLNHMGATVQRYLHTVGAGDFARACDILTDSGKAKLIAEQQAATCEAAAERWRSSLSPSQVDWLVHGQIWVNGYAAEDSRKEIKLFGNPLGINNWAIYKHAGREWISDWGPGAQQIPPASS